MEKIYKTMRNTGAASIAVGVIVASVGTGHCFLRENLRLRFNRIRAVLTRL